MLTKFTFLPFTHFLFLNKCFFVPEAVIVHACLV